MAHRRLTKKANLEASTFGSSRAAEVLADKLSNKFIDRRFVNRIGRIVYFASLGSKEILNIKQTGFRNFYKKALLQECERRSKEVCEKEYEKLNILAPLTGFYLDVHTYTMNVIRGMMKVASR